MHTLEQEVQKFEQMRMFLCEHCPKKWVLIKGNKLWGIHDSFEDAIAAGYYKFKGDSMLVKQILEQDPVIHIPTMWVLSTTFSTRIVQFYTLSGQTWVETHDMLGKPYRFLYSLLINKTDRMPEIGASVMVTLDAQNHLTSATLV